MEDRAKQTELYRQIQTNKLSVRQAEALVGSWAPGRRRRVRRVDPQLQQLEDELRRTLSTKVSLFARKKGGRIVIEYFSPEDLARILQALGVVT